MNAVNTEIPLGRLKPVRYVRLSRGFSQRELEEAIGLPRTTLSHIESGRRKADPVTKYRLALALKVDEELLWGGRG